AGRAARAVEPIFRARAARPADPRLRRRRHRVPRDQELPLRVLGHGRHAQLPEQAPERAEPVHRVGPDRPALLVGRADQEPRRRVLRVAAAARRRGARGRQACVHRKGEPVMRYVGGVDVGSTQTKAVILDENGKVVGRALLDMETSMVTIAQDAFKAALNDAGIEEAQVARVASTGYGRYNVSFGHEQVTEISCHARGAVALFPDTRTVIDMGGQDTKAIAVKPGGQVADFTMNDKCAAGTGRFLGAASYALEMSLGELGPLAMQSQNPV